jgi:hypothetical protein
MLHYSTPYQSLVGLFVSSSCRELGSIHKRMRKPHFAPVDGAVARRLKDGQDIVVLRVEDDALGGGLEDLDSSQSRVFCLCQYLGLSFVP